MTIQERICTAYERAAYLPKLEETGVIALTDLDGTMTTGDDPPSKRELTDRSNVRTLLEKRGVVTGAVTARTASLTVSSKMYESSESLYMAEVAPRWGKDPDTNKKMYVPLEEVPFFDSCLDFDFTASFGSVIAIKNGSGYMVDREYFNELRYDYNRSKDFKGFDREPWRHVMREFIHEELSDFKRYESPLEKITNYRGGITDTAPLNFRIQYNFTGSEGLEAMVRLKDIIRDFRQMSSEESNWYEVVLRIKMVDESKPHPTDPERSRYTLYLIPWGARKENMIHRVLEQSAKAAKRDVKDIRLFYAGDTLTDLRAGLYAGGDAKLTFLLATGSRLAPHILRKEKKFGDEDLSFLWPAEGRHQFESQFVAAKKKGVYRFVHKIRKDRVNTVIIGDERYPGLTPPGSVHAFLEEFL